MIYEEQAMITPDAKDMNGNTWNRYFINTYNQYTKDINKSAGIEVKKDSLTEKERQFFLDQRHKSYIQFCEITAEPKHYSTENSSFILNACCVSKTTP